MDNRLLQGEDELSVFFLAQGEQTGEMVARRLAAFIGQAQTSLDMAPTSRRS
jgi:hypothetical protein